MHNRVDLDVAVIIPAAGSGTRLGGRRKQYRLLGNASLLVQTLRRFDAHPMIDAIVVAAPPSDVTAVRADIEKAGITRLVDVVAGGISRRDSVSHGLEAMPPGIGLVLVHDAVRPFVDGDVISSVISHARETGAAAAALESADTLRMVENGFFEATVPRERVYRMQTPQAFHRNILMEAYRRARDEGWTATDDVELVRLAGHRVRLVDGNPMNLKVTTADDWKLAQILWNEIGMT